jgi:hypothetical protein
MMDSMTAGILGSYDRASQREDHYRDGATWYTDSRRFARRLARETGASERTAAGVIAALSPRQTWAGNQRAARAVLVAAQRRDRQPPRVGLGRSVAQAWAIAHGARPLSVLSGPKVRSFYRNLTGDLQAVTVDVWAARAAGVDPDRLTPRLYELVAGAYIAAAQEVGVPPAVLQAIVWTEIRGRAA